MAHQPINRREFLQLAGIAAAGLSIPSRWMPVYGDNLAPIDVSALPEWILGVFDHAPACQVDPDGYLVLQGSTHPSTGRIPVARTEWNLEKCLPVHRLDTPARWAIVLHWYGDRSGFDRTVTGYLRGFDELRMIAGNLTRTSSHFLVGDAIPNTEESQKEIGFLQTQIPGPSGIPYLASHLQPKLDYLAHQEKRQYFVRAYYQLAVSYPKLHSVMQDWFDGSSLDPNWRSLAIELTGADFEKPGHFPQPQQIASTLAVIWALMNRYNIQAVDVLGHHEIQLDKSDPGKVFLAVMRLLLGIQALNANDARMNRLVFGAFENSAESYFRFQREHLALIGTPAQVYTWEKTTGYWRVMEALFGPVANSGIGDRLIAPLEGKLKPYGDRFLSPQSHAGVDLFPSAQGSGMPSARLVAGGECLYAGRSKGAHPGKAAVFRHRRPDGTSLITIYSHLEELGELTAGRFYPQGTTVGSLRRAGQEAFLHFAIALGGAWENGLKNAPDLPPDASPNWIRARFLDPMTCIPELAS